MQENRDVVLIDENDNAITLEVIASLKVNNVDYAILHDSLKDEDHIFKVLKRADEEQFEQVTDEDERQEVVDAYYEL